MTYGDSYAVVVGESHFNTQAETDDHYEHIVKPTFFSAQVALMETHFGPENIGNQLYNRYFPCENNAERRSERLGPKFAELIEEIRRAKLEVPVWFANWEAFPEISLATGLTLDWYASTVNPLIQAAEKAHDDDRGVSERLAAEAAASRRKRPKIGGLDDLGILRNHFCNAPAEYREDQVLHALENVIGALRRLETIRRTGQPVNLEPEVSNAWVRSLACAESAKPCDFPSPDERGPLSHYGISPGSTPGVFKLSIEARTSDWLKLMMRALQEHRRVFVIMGSSHLPDLRFEHQIYPGLLTLLRRSGCRVTAIHDENDVPGSYLHPAWWDDLLSF